MVQLPIPVVMMRGDAVVGTDDSSIWWSIHPTISSLEASSAGDEMPMLGIERALWSTSITGSFSVGTLLPVDALEVEKRWFNRDDEEGEEARISEIVRRCSSIFLSASPALLPPSSCRSCKARRNAVPNPASDARARLMESRLD